LIVFFEENGKENYMRQRLETLPGIPVIVSKLPLLANEKQPENEGIFADGVAASIQLQAPAG
jgi:hypothetical protein